MDLRLSSEEKAGIHEFKQDLLRLFEDRLCLFKIFGSKSRGDEWEESDLDTLVLIESLTDKEKKRVWDEATRINIQYDILISPLVMTPKEFRELRDREKRIALDIDSEGIEI